MKPSARYLNNAHSCSGRQADTRNTTRHRDDGQRAGSRLSRQACADYPIADLVTALSASAHQRSLPSRARAVRTCHRPMNTKPPSLTSTSTCTTMYPMTFTVKPRQVSPATATATHLLTQVTQYTITTCTCIAIPIQASVMMNDALHRNPSTHG